MATLQNLIGKRFSVQRDLAGGHITDIRAINESDQSTSAEPVEYVWTAWMDNPFRAIEQAATQAGRPQDYARALEVLKESATWDDFAQENYLDDLLQEIAGATNIVCQHGADQANHQYRAIYDDGPRDEESASPDRPAAPKG